MTNIRDIFSRLDDLPSSIWHVKIAGLIATALFLVAYDITIISVAAPILRKAWGLSEATIGVIYSAGFWGLFVGGIVDGVIADAVGRRKALISTMFLYGLMILLSAFVQSSTELIILRFLAGIGMGGAVAIRGAYTSEFMPRKTRGRFLGIFGMLWGLGDAAAYGIGAYVFPMIAEGWRYAFGIGGILPILVAFILWAGLPESPRWLLSQGKIKEAVEVVEKVERKVLGEPTVPFEKALKIEQEKYKSRSRETSSWDSIKALFSPGVGKVQALLSTIWFCFNYAKYGLIAWLPMFLARYLHYPIAHGLNYMFISTAVTTPLSALTAGYFMDYAGRRGTLATFSLLFAIGGFFLAWLGTNPLLAVIILGFMGYSLGIVPNSLGAFSSEVLPTKLRGAGIGLATSIGRVAGAIAGLVTGILAAWQGLYGVMTMNLIFIIIAVAAVFAFPETKGKSLEVAAAEVSEGSTE